MNNELSLHFEISNDAVLERYIKARQLNYTQLDQTLENAVIVALIARLDELIAKREGR